jgi:hypothetical protein
MGVGGLLAGCSLAAVSFPSFHSSLSRLNTRNDSGLTLPNQPSLLMESSTSRLLSLPAEILEVVIDEACSSAADLSTLSLVCRGLHWFITPSLYRSINLVGYKSAKQFAWTIFQRPDFAPLVRKLQIHSHGTDENEDENCSEDFDSTITQLINLNSLALRTDFFNRSKAQKLGIICRPHEVLPALRSSKQDIPLAVTLTLGLAP